MLDRGRVITASVAVVAVAALAVLGASVAAAGPLGPDSRGRHFADRPHRRRDSADQRQGSHAVLVRPGYRHQFGLLRDVRRVLAAGDRAAIPGPGVTGKLATIKRSDGSVQATYDGHPLYTYIGDSATDRPTATTST